MRDHTARLVLGDELLRRGPVQQVKSLEFAFRPRVRQPNRIMTVRLEGIEDCRAEHTRSAGDENLHDQKQAALSIRI